MKDINLQEFCKELHIYEFGIAPWPLPENAKTILYETNPCPFTAADVEERLLGTTEFTPKSAIVCLFPYYVEHNGPSNLSRYTWGTDYHLVINEYLEKLIEKLKIETQTCKNECISFGIYADDLKECIKEKSNSPYWEKEIEHRVYDLRNPCLIELKRKIFKTFGLDADKTYEENLKIMEEE